ncbi:uncharacterized protein P884DRAFT_98242 [Thermothelomyces heterothallicus CBS 202.75]|uniref:uncharacterized protein n=1 Tax=Thermothelomyces heterothallicus CBS 202.75 TaxID=1149848 RepID=UPI0037442AA8
MFSPCFFLIASVSTAAAYFPKLPSQVPWFTPNLRYALASSSQRRSFRLLDFSPVMRCLTSKSTYPVQASMAEPRTSIIIRESLAKSQPTYSRNERAKPPPV